MKSSTGRFFEDFSLGELIVHPTPRTLRESDMTLYQAVTGSRFVLDSSEVAAKRAGFQRMPADDLLVFHFVFGKSVPDISINAIANLGYAEGQFHAPVYPGATLRAQSTVIGLKENSNKKTGIVYVHTEGFDETGQLVLSFKRWVMVRKRDINSHTGETVVPDCAEFVDAGSLTIPAELENVTLLSDETSSNAGFEDYAIGERIEHTGGMGIMESEHRIITKLYQNTAQVHFNDFSERQGRLGQTIVYGGVVISTARALSFNGLANCVRILAINGGRHVNPCVAGDTVFAWSEVLDKAELSERAGALRLRLVAAKNQPCGDFPRLDGEKRYLPNVILDFDYWALIPKKAAIE